MSLHALLHGNRLLYILFASCAMRIFTKSFVAPRVAGGFQATSRRGKCLCDKRLRRRFQSPEKYFSDELRHWPNLAFFENAEGTKQPRFRGPQKTADELS